MADIITQEQLLKLKEAKDKAMEDTTPFPVMKDGTLAVVGDANKTEINKHDFELQFIIPNEDGGYNAKTVEYKDVWLKPRQAVTVQRVMTALQPLFHFVQEDGTIRDLSDDEMMKLVDLYEGNVIDLVYKLVAAVLGIDERLVDYIDPESAIVAFRKIMLSYTDVVKASESFFGLLPGKKKENPSNNG